MPLHPTRPRMWIQGTGKLAYWQAVYAGYLASDPLATAQWNQLVNSPGYGSFAYTDVIAYKASGLAAHLNAALARVDGWMASGLPLPNVAPNAGITYSSWHNAREWSRDMGITYDMLYTELGATRRAYLENQMMAVLYILFHNSNDPVALTIWNNGGSPLSTNVSGEGKRPGHVFFNTYLMAASYCTAAMYPNRTTFDNPSGGAPIDFILPYHYDTAPPPGAQATYTDLQSFLQDRFQYLAFPAFENEPTRYFEGGSLVQGQSYGMGSRMYHGEFMAMLKSAGLDYAATHQYLTDMVQYQFYCEQPGRRAMMCFGEFAATAPGDGIYQALNDYARRAMLGQAQMHAGTPAGEYAQWWLENVRTAITGSPNDADRSLDFLLYEYTRGPGIDPTTVLPTHWVARGQGIFNSRDGWGPNAVSVWMRGGPTDFDNEDADAGNLVIFRDSATGTPVDGYLLCEAQSFEDLDEDGKGTKWQTWWHNICTPFDTVTPGGTDPTHPAKGWYQHDSRQGSGVRPRINRMSGDDTYAYARMDGGDIYWTLKSVSLPSATVRRQINDVFVRSVVHLKETNVVVVYDRVRVRTSPYDFATGCIFKYRWFYRALPSLVAGAGILGTYRVAVNTSYLYRKQILGDVAARTDVVEQTIQMSAPCYVEEVDMPLDAASARMVTAFQAGANTLATMAPTIAIDKDGGPAAMTMEGVSVDGDFRSHLLFSTETDGATPATINYFAQRQGATDRHYVSDLVPGQSYDITETPAGGGLYEYTIAPGSAFTADDAGLLVFEAGDLGPPPTYDDLPLAVDAAISAATVGLTSEMAHTQRAVAAVTVQADVLPADPPGPSVSGNTVRTYSEWIYAGSTEAQNVYRATHNDLCIGNADNDRDAMKAASPDVKTTGYLLPRLANAWTVSQWEIWAPLNGATAELGYIHQSSVRVTVPGNGWHVMNMGYAPYRQFIAEAMVLVAKGEWYGTPGQFTYPPAHEFVIYDLALYYPEFDVVDRYVLDSDEYFSTNPADYTQGSGTFGAPADYENACAQSIADAQAELDATFIWPPVHLMPNLGSPLFVTGAYAARPSTMQALAAVRAVEIQQIVSYAGDKIALPASASSLLTQMQFVNDWCGAGRYAAGHFMITDATTTTKRDRAGLAAAAMYMLHIQDRMYCRFCTDDEFSANDPSTWEFPEVLRTANAYLGHPTGPMVEQSDGLLKTRLFVRPYQYGVALLCLQAAGQTGSDPATYTPAVSVGTMAFDGSVSAPVASVDLTVGEGVILVQSPVAGRIVPTTDSTPLEAVPVGGTGSHSDRVREAIEAYSEAELLQFGTYGMTETLTVGTDPDMPQDIGLCTQIIARIRRTMINGVPDSPTGVMWIPFRLLSGGLDVGHDVIPVLANDPWTSIDLVLPVSLSQAQMNALKIQIDTFTSGGAGEWIGTPTRFQVATINLDIEYIPAVTEIVTGADVTQGLTAEAVFADAVGAGVAIEASAEMVLLAGAGLSVTALLEDVAPAAEPASLGILTSRIEPVGTKISDIALVGVVESKIRNY